MMDSARAERELIKERERVDRILAKVSAETGFPIVQKHGQRIYGGPPPNWTGPVPERGTELYCYRIPRDCYEDELVPVFSSAGTLYELRLMIEFSGANRGYCYVRYATLADADQARRKLNNVEIRPGVWLNVTKSVDNKKCLIKTFPPVRPQYSERDILEELQRLLSGVIGVRRVDSLWLEVEFDCHRGAAMARRQVVPGCLSLFGQANITQVDWADPDMEGATSLEKTSRHQKLFVRFPQCVHVGRLRSFFNSLCKGQGRVMDISVGSTFGCVVFDSPEAARLVMEKKEELRLEGERIFVERWNPRRRELSPPEQATKFSSPLEELLHLSLVKGWGEPQYSMNTSVDNNLQPLYKYTITFTSVPFKVVGEACQVESQAFINCTGLALQGIRQQNLLAATGPPPLIHYIPHTSHVQFPPFTPTSPLVFDFDIPLPGIKGPGRDDISDYYI